MKKVLSIICALALAVTACISLCGCGEKYSYWQISGKESDEVRLIYVSELSLSSSSVEVSEVWVNVSNLKPSASILTMVFATASSTVKTVDVEITANTLKQAEDGWINFYFGDVIKCTKVTVQAVDQMRINEVVFIKSDATMLKPTFSQGGVKVSSNGNSGNVYTREKLDALPKTDPAYNENPAYNIIDEQDRFPTSLIKTQK